MSISPWAILITRMTPNVMASPSAVRIRMELRLKLLERTALRSVALIGNFSETQTCRLQLPDCWSRICNLQWETQDSRKQDHETLTSLPLVTPPLVQSQCQPGKAT